MFPLKDQSKNPAISYNCALTFVFPRNNMCTTLLQDEGHEVMKSKMWHWIKCVYSFIFLRPRDVGMVGNYAPAPSTGGWVVVIYGQIDLNLEVGKPNSHV
jgi:hypothetical protein